MKRRADSAVYLAPAPMFCQLSLALCLAVAIATYAPPVAAELSFGNAEKPEEAWAWLRSENDHVNEGNAQMASGDPKGAQAAYEEAAKELPSSGGVHLNRGLALLAQGDLANAREALQLATQPPARAGVRAAGYYNLGNAFYKEADQLAGQQEHQQAQQLFREAVDAYKQALRLSPGDQSAVWNLELAARRLTEEQQKQEQKDKENQDEQNQDENKDKDKDQQQGDQQQNDQQKSDKQDSDKQDSQEPGQDEKKQDEPKQDPPKPEQDEGQKDPPDAQPAPQPSDVDRALDALQDGEENLERHRARQRAASQRRRPEKDW
ncbi:MAG: tetratricopeptide repeat protein [Myxococcales bacterium]|nr:tetratricopeptide repeat protein [Myxococcales bacterium]